MVAKVHGSPTSEHRRSPAALAVAGLASVSNLFFAHFEHRTQLRPPEAWLGGAAWEPPRFVGGVLPEPKYQSFRHDLLIASFHPGHRAKWTAHELTHALVGFGYRPGAPGLFHAIAAWLAELLPVTLWYFFDEAGVRRCTHHQYGGPIFQVPCEACEVAALDGARRLGAEDRARLVEGRAFLDRELAAIARSRRLGRPRGNVHASIDLASDGLAYAASHGPRLEAPEMERYVAQFFATDQGCHATLESLEARVEEVARGILGEGPVRPWRCSRWDYAAQDVGYRLLTLGARASEGVARELDSLIDRLAQDRTARGVRRTIREYEALWAASSRRARAELEAPSELFAVGYALTPEHGSSVRQLHEGVSSACPNTLAAFGRGARDVVRAFAQKDRAERLPIGRRFARFLSRTRPSALAELACVEAAITHVGSRDRFAAQLDPREARDARVVLASHAELVTVHHDVLGRPASKLKRITRKGDEVALLIARARDGEVDVMELPADTARLLSRTPERGVDRSTLGLDAAAVDALLDAGALVPASYSL